MAANPTEQDTVRFSLEFPVSFDFGQPIAYSIAVVDHLLRGPAPPPTTAAWPMASQEWNS